MTTTGPYAGTPSELTLTDWRAASGGFVPGTKTTGGGSHSPAHATGWTRVSFRRIG